MEGLAYDLFFGSNIPQPDQYPSTVVTKGSYVPLFTFTGNESKFYCYPTEPVNIEGLPDGARLIRCSGPPVGRFSPEPGRFFDVFRAPASLGPLPAGTVIMVGGTKEVTEAPRRSATNHASSSRTRRSTTHHSSLRSSQEDMAQHSSSASNSSDTSDHDLEDSSSMPSSSSSHRRRLIDGYAGDGGNAEGSNGDEMCPICLEELSRGVIVKRCPQCHHPFHPHCLGWERESMQGYLRCPTCRCRLSGRGLK